jgi:hypothetical protein
MAIKEFAEMANNNRAAALNNDQRRALTTTLGSSSSTGNSLPLPIYQPEMPSEFERFLGSRGIDVEDFKKVIFDGEMDSSLDSVLSTFGKDPKGYSLEEISRGQEKAQKEYSKISNEVQSNMNSNNGGGVGGAMAKNQDASGEPGASGEGLDKSSDSSKKDTKSTKSDSSASGEREAPQGFSAGFTAKPLDAHPQGLLFETYLKEQGLVPTRVGSNIFQVAHQNYRAFNNWRAKDPGKKSQLSSRK